MNSRDIFINNLKTIMKERKVSRRQLAEGLNIPYTTLTDWCTGRIFPRVEKINLIADYFNIKKSDLIEEITDEDDDALYDDVVKVDVFSKLFLDSVWCLKNESFLKHQTETKNNFEKTSTLTTSTYKASSSSSVISSIKSDFLILK